MDPVTLIATATASYQAIKKGFALGKEVTSMSKDIGKLMGAIGQIKEGHEKAKGRRFGSVEEEALHTYAAKKKAETMEAELRNFLVANYGFNAWRDVLKVQGDLRKERQAKKRKRERLIEAVMEWTLVSVIIAILIGLGIFIIVSIRG